MRAELEAATGLRFRAAPDALPSGGGFATCQRWESEHGPVFVKTATLARSDALAAEADALRALATAQALRVPDVLGTGTAGAQAFLVLEWIEFGPVRAGSEARLGAGLARLHQASAAQFGWHRDNTIGASDVYWDAVADVRYAYDDIEERFGVRPERMADFLALMGDAVDNIPGVPGVGRKTAATLLKHFDTLPGVYDNLAAIPKLKFRGATFVAQSLEEHRESAFLSRQLTAIACDMPLDARLDELERRPPDLAAVEAFYERLGFGRLLREQARRVADRHR
jgi:hypothetical protein